MRTQAEVDVFAAIAHPARRAMLAALRSGERSAGSLAEPFEMTFGAVSQHLRVLEEAELVVVRKDGRNRYYRLSPAPIREVEDWAASFRAYFEGRLDALGEYLDQKHPRRG